MKFYYIVNKNNQYKIFSLRGKMFTSKTGAFMSFCSWYRDRSRIPGDIRPKIFEGVPKQGVYSKESTKNIRVIFNTHYDVVEVNV